VVVEEELGEVLLMTLIKVSTLKVVLETKWHLSEGLQGSDEVEEEALGGGVAQHEEGRGGVVLGEESSVCVNVCQPEINGVVIEKSTDKGIKEQPRSVEELERLQ